MAVVDRYTKVTRENQGGTQRKVGCPGLLTVGPVWPTGGSVLETCLSLFLSFQIMNIMWCLLYESSFNYHLYFADEETEVQRAFRTSQTIQWEVG